MAANTSTLALPKIKPGMILAGRYRILSRIGQGGMGHVYAAQEESLGITRMVAIKVLPPQFMLDEGLLARFREEIKIASALDHPHIVPIYTLGEHQSVFFYVMKLLDGQTAYQRVHERGVFTEAELRGTIAPMARALHYAHSKGVIHRDIKSNNIHINGEGFPTLMDFGIARSGASSELTSPGQVVGTAECMAPEQWYGQAEPRSDIYSLGVVMFELITGNLPFRSKHAFELMKLHQEVEPPSPKALRPSISTELSDIILKCVAKDPNDRFATALAVAEALEKPPRSMADDEAPEDVAPTIDREALTQSNDIPTPTVDLSPEDKKVWNLCVQADDKYAAGDLDGALKLTDKAMRLAPENPQVTARAAKFAKMKDIVEKILERGDQSLEEGRPRVAIKDYENILRVLPIPAIADKLAKAEKQAKQADDMLKQAWVARNAGKYDRAFELGVGAKKLNRELDNGAVVAPQPKKINHRRKTKTKTKRQPILTAARTFVFLTVATLVAVVALAKPALVRVADYTFQDGTPKAWYLGEFSAHRLYTVLSYFPGQTSDFKERLATINAAAKEHYLALSKKAIEADDYAAAVRNLHKAREHDPTDPRIVDLLGVYEAKLKVKQSMN
jgi:serine/threonine protein kinase